MKRLVSVSLLGLGAIVTALLLSEAALQAVAPADFLGKPVVANVDFVYSHAVFGWRTRPHLDVRSVRIFGDKPRPTVLRTNGRGFRGPELEERKRAGVRRIVCLGDSGTFGLWHDASEIHFESYVDHLRDAWAQRVGADRVEVVNAGVVGYTSSHGLRLLAGELLAFQPDVVTVRFGYNDHQPMWIPALQAHYPSDPLARSALRRFGGWWWFRLGFGVWRTWIAAQPEAGTVPSVDRARFAANLRDFAELSREHGFALLFIDYPIGSHDDAAHRIHLGRLARISGEASAEALVARHERYQEILAARAGELGIPLLRSAEALRASTVPVFEPQDPVHPNPAGASLLARLLLDELERRDL